MENKTVTFIDKDIRGRVIKVTWNDFPILSKEERIKVKKETPASYQRLLAF